ncbi:MAG: hypothetical protein LUC34_03935, partial [Campylobacter sp.]|nr:hypothetical protein [Campylobacter sp.]
RYGFENGLKLYRKLKEKVKLFYKSANMPNTDKSRDLDDFKGSVLNMHRFEKKLPSVKAK